MLWPYKWHGSLPGADPLQLSPLPGSSCCERSCQLYSVHHGQSLHTMFLLYEQKSCFCIILIWYKACYLNELNVKPNDLFSIVHIIHTCIIRSKLHSISFIDYKDFWQLCDYFFLQGCYDKLEEYIKQNGIIIGTAAIVTAVFMVNSHCNTNIPAFNTCINYQDWFLSLLKTYYIHPPN